MSFDPQDAKPYLLWVQDPADGSRDKKMMQDMLEEHFEVLFTGSDSVDSTATSKRPRVLVVDLYQPLIHWESLVLWVLELKKNKTHEFFVACICPQSALQEAIQLNAELVLQRPLAVTHLVQQILQQIE